MEIYIDLVFFVNFLMNALILYLTGKILKTKTGKVRIFMASVLSSLLFCIFFAVFGERIPGIISGLLTFLPGVFIAFRHDTPSAFLKRAVTALILTFAIGGAATAVYYSDLGGILILTARKSLSPASVKVLAISSVLFYVLAKSAAHIYMRLRGSQTVMMKIIMDGLEVEIPALIDTGQNLTEPAGNNPVAVAEYLAVREMLPPGMRRLFENHKEDDLAELLSSAQSDGFNVRIRMIPYKSVGVSHGMMVGFLPDSVCFGTKNGNAAKVIIGIYNGTLTKNGDYRALLNACLAEGD